MNSANSVPEYGRKPSVLGCMILTRMIANSKAPARSQVVSDLRPLFAESLSGSETAWKQLIAQTMTELFSLNCVNDPVRKSEITDRGRDVLREFLRTDKLPERKSWATIKKLVLAPIAFGEKPESSKDMDRIGKADGFHAELLRHLFKLNLKAFPSLPLAISAVAAKHGLHAKKPTADSLREAFLRSWVASAGHQVFSIRTDASAANLPTAEDLDSLPVFASRIQQIARSLPGSQENGKVFISKIWDFLKSSSDTKTLSRERFDEMLLQSNRAQLLSLCRADLSAGLNPDELKDSELLPEFGDKFHFVRTDGG